MFYCLNLLIRQHGGKFCDPWLAATRGIHYLPKNKIIAANIVQICADIVLMIETSSTKPSLRLSLSLSSRLLNGTVKIHRRQVEIVLEEIVKFLATVQKPPTIAEITESQQGTPDSPIPRVQRKRKRQAVRLTQENELEVLALTDVLNMESVLEVSVRNQADVDLITLREDLVTNTGRFDIACSEFGVFPDIEPIIQDVPLSSVQPTQDKTSKRIAEVGQPQTPSKRIRTSTRISKKTVTAPEIQLLPPDVEQENLIQVLNDDEQENYLQVEIPTVQQQILPEVVPEAENIEPRRVRRPKVNKINITIQNAPRFLNINRKDQCDFPSITDNQQHLEKFIPLQEVDIASLVVDFMEGTHEIEEILATSPRGRSSLVPSLNLSHRRLSKGSRSRSILQEVTRMPSLVESEGVAEIGGQILVPVEVHAPHTPVVTAPIQQSIREQSKEILTPLTESTAIGFHVLENVIEPCTVEEVTAPPAAERDLARARKVLPFTSNADDNSRNRKDRQKRIRRIVYTWTEGDITIEDVCYKPINRYSLAATFGDLLSLQAMGYVKLNNKPNSLELGSIEKGPKLIR